MGGTSRRQRQAKRRLFRGDRLIEDELGRVTTAIITLMERLRQTLSYCKRRLMGWHLYLDYSILFICHFLRQYR
jgi:hypothetical protein